jgi:hypothetical protein
MKCSHGSKIIVILRSYQMSTMWLNSFFLFLFRRLERDLQKLGEEFEKSHEDA